MPDGPTLGSKLIRFCLSGVATTLLHVALASIFVVWFEVSGTVANTAAFLIANVVSYFLNAIWSFEAGVYLQNYSRFLIVSLAGLAATISISAFVEWLGYPASYSIAAVAILLPALSFLIHNIWTFRRR